MCSSDLYFMTAFPCALVLLMRGIAALDGRLGALVGASLAMLFVAIDVQGTWVEMPRVYADTSDPVLQWTRLSAVHPALLPGDWRWAFLALQIGALAVAVAGVVYASRLRARDA